MTPFTRRTFVALVVVALVALAADATSAATRHYYIAAENVVWDFAPTGLDLIHGEGSSIPRPWTNYTRWNKVRYIEYTNASFLTRKPQPDWLGVLGPIIRAEVGDTIVIHFLNRANGYYGIHPHGVRYDKNNEGAHYFGADGTPPGDGSQIAPGGTFTYTWLADEGSGPGPNDPSSIVWWYHSHVNEPEETNAGLLGPIVITAAGKANPDATPNDVDREFVVLFMIFNEDKGRERGLMHGINGFIFGNLPGLVMNSGDRVRWYLLGMGNEVDLHSAHWHGKTLMYHQRHTDVVELLPGSMATADMRADNVGTWLMHCHVADHIDAGMIATYKIQP